MTKEILKFALLFVLLTLAQVVVFNHICLFGVAIPLVFIYLIIKLPISLRVNWVMTVSFLLGMTVDILSNTQGMNALACTILAVSRNPVLHLYMPRQDNLPNSDPSSVTLGYGVFMKYALTLCAIYCTLFFVIEAFTFFDLMHLCLQIVSSTALTFIIIVALDSLTSQKK